MVPDEYVATRDVCDCARLFEKHVRLVVYQRASPYWLDDAARRAIDRLAAPTRFIIEPGRTGFSRIAAYVADQAPLALDLMHVAELVADLTGAETVGVRLAACSEPPCPAFHVDKVLVRAAVTYAGAGSQWLPEADVDRRMLGKASLEEVRAGSDPAARGGASVLQVERFDIALVKGERWPDNQGRSLVHRSPPANGEVRLLATFDPLS